MKICVAQTKPMRGDIEQNILAHLRLTERAVACGADVVVFPELSLTGYEPSLAAELAFQPSDARLDVFQTLANKCGISVCLGLPTPLAAGVAISMAIIQPRAPRNVYSKQYLHSDEKPYFVEGTEACVVRVRNRVIAPAICYESLLPEHAAQASGRGAEIYIAAVAKSAAGVEKAFAHYPAIAQRHSMIVAMSNCVGRCDNFESVGRSALWSAKGELLGALGAASEAILTVDVESDIELAYA
jgi:predicted amidohydrolase